MANGYTPPEWNELGWSGEAASSTGIENLLGQFFATPGEYTQYFQDYDPMGEQAAQQQMQLGQQQAQSQAQASMWKQFEAGRQGRGGFGGAGRARQASMAGMFKGLETGREQAQLGLQEDIRGMREQYRGDVMSQIGQLFAGGAEGPVVCDEGEHMAADGSCVPDYSGTGDLNCADNEYEENGQCVEDPCYNVSCTTGTHCEDGTCVSDAPLTGGPTTGTGGYTPAECAAMGMVPDGQGGCVFG